VGVIAGYPSGLLGLLDAQNFGSNPKYLAEGISATVELRDLFMVSKQVGIANSNVAPAASFNLFTGGSGPTTVPHGELWYITTHTLIVICGAGASGNFAPAVRVNGLVIPLSELVAAPATFNTPVVGKVGGFWLPSGADLGFYANNVVLAPTVAGQTLVTRLRT